MHSYSITLLVCTEESRAVVYVAFEFTECRFMICSTTHIR